MNSEHLDSVDELPEYRPLSKFAILCFVVGLASGLALVAPMFWWIPPVTAVLCLIAYRAVNFEEQAGRGLVTFGMAMAVMFLACTVAQEVSRGWWIRYHAERFGDYWVKLVQDGKLADAYAYTRERAENAPPQPTDSNYSVQSLDTQMEEELYASDLEKFFSQDPLRSLTTGEAKLEFLSANVSRFTYSDQVLLNYRITLTEGGQQKQIPLKLVLERVYSAPKSQYLWHVEAVDG